MENVLDGSAAWTVAEGDALSLLRSMPDNSVHCCVTSPPYWGLRSYPAPPVIWGGDPDCEHEWTHEERSGQTGGDGRTSTLHAKYVNGHFAPSSHAHPQSGKVGSDFCLRCDAWRGQLGLEPDPALFIAHLIEIFREVRRVLHPSGTLWLNVGDSYSGSGKGNNPSGKQGTNKGTRTDKLPNRYKGFPAKSLMMIPARLALALQDDGWILRSDIIWAKPSPMPGSQQDRPTASHEHVFLLARRRQYYFDAEAVKERSVSDHPSGNGYKRDARLSFRDDIGARGSDTPWQPTSEGRMIRDVWTIASESNHEAHYASFPREIPRRCIAAGCPSEGIVLDPFAGTSTTGVAALQQGRRFIGLELARSYVAISERRLRRVVAVVHPGQELPAQVAQQRKLAL